MKAFQSLKDKRDAMDLFCRATQNLCEHVLTNEDRVLMKSWAHMWFDYQDNGTMCFPSSMGTRNDTESSPTVTGDRSAEYDAKARAA